VCSFYASVSENRENSLLPGRVFNLPGRGVLRFLAQAYRNSVHFSAFFAKNTKNCPI